MNPTKFAIQVEHSKINTRLDTKQNVIISEHNSIIFKHNSTFTNHYAEKQVHNSILVSCNQILKIKIIKINCWRNLNYLFVALSFLSIIVKWRIAAPDVHYCQISRV